MPALARAQVQLKLSEGWDELQVCAACARLCKTVKRLQVRVCEGTWTWC
jgi:hypothetical protein